MISFIIAMVIVVYLHMTLGEMVPKNLALAAPERSAIALGPPLYVIVTVLKPLLWLMNATANIVLRIMRVTPADEVASTFTADEIQAYVHQSGESGILDERERDLMVGAVAFGTHTARDVLVPRTDLVVLNHGADAAEAERVCVETGFSRFPVTGSDEELIGYVHLKDLLTVMLEEDPTPLGERIRPLVQISADAGLDEVLAAMQQQGSHIAVVHDGDRVLGAAMLEDVVEMMVGDVTEENPA